MASTNSTSKRTNVRYRPMGELIRGIIFILFAVYVMYGQQLFNASFDISETAKIILTIVLGGYGLFRVYRGLKGIFSHEESN